MKREKFLIKYVDGVALAYSWNGALRKVRDIARDMARAEGRAFHLTQSQCEKDETGKHYKGFQVWGGFRFDIEKAAE